MKMMNSIINKKYANQNNKEIKFILIKTDNFQKRMIKKIQIEKMRNSKNWEKIF